jgi:hypothetical protein
VRILVVVLGQIAGENVNENIKPLPYARNWGNWKYCVLPAAGLLQKKIYFLIVSFSDRMSFATSTG